jgi:hypothetical protein
MHALNPVRQEDVGFESFGLNSRSKSKALDAVDEAETDPLVRCKQTEKDQAPSKSDNFLCCSRTCFSGCKKQPDTPVIRTKRSGMSRVPIQEAIT